MKTLNECKNEVAQKDGYRDFEAIPHHLFEEYFERAAELYASEFNKPPVYGQWIDVKERLPEPNILVLCVDHRFNRMMVADWMDYTNQDKEWFTRMFTHWTTLPPSPGSVDVEEKKECQHEALTDTGVGYHHCPTCNASFKVDGLGDSSGSEKEKSQFREPSTQGEKDAYSAGLMCERILAKDEIERLKQENERLKEEYDSLNDVLVIRSGQVTKLRQEHKKLEISIDSVKDRCSSEMSNYIAVKDVLQALNPKD